MKIRILLFVLALLSLALRAWNIELRPLHADEGVNYQLALDSIAQGYYAYSNKNFHGPLLFYAIAGSFQVFGISELSLRLPSILASAALVLLVWNLFPRELHGARIIAAILCALSPSLVYFGRYAIHESLLCLGTLWLVFSVCRAQCSPRLSYLQASVAGLVMAATKETWIINLATLALAAILTVSPRKLILVLSNQRTPIITALLVWANLIVLTYTACFLYSQGLDEFFRGYLQWLKRGVSGDIHSKPFSYYFEIILQAEQYLFLGLILALPRMLSGDMQQRRWIRFFFWWSLCTLLGYSLIPYKTPWIVINCSLPLLLLTAATLAELPQTARIVASTAMILCAILLCYRYNFQYPFGSMNPFSYHHTQKGALEFVTDVHSFLKQHANAKVVINLNNPWPLPYYLREVSTAITYMQPLPKDIFEQGFDMIVTDNPRIQPPNGTTARSYRFSDYITGQGYTPKLPLP